jgi:hypothetical protein
MRPTTFDLIVLFDFPMHAGDRTSIYENPGGKG